MLMQPSELDDSLEWVDAGGAQAPDAQAQQLWLTGPVAPRHVGSSQTRARTRVPCIGRQTELEWLYHRCRGDDLVTSVGNNTSGLALQWRFRLWEPRLPSRPMSPSRVKFATAAVIVSGHQKSATVSHEMSGLNWKPFVYGGLASIVAEFGTFPVDLTKTRLQVQGQSIDVRFKEIKYRGMFHALFRIYKEEGVLALYSGSALCSRKLIRMQAQGSLFQGSMIGSFIDIYQQEGTRGLWRGVVPTAQRAAIVVGVELPVYDITKKHLILSGVMGDTILTHFVSSFTCGLAGALASNPVDVVRTRMMNQRAIVGHVDLYKGTLDGILKVHTL
ncbi:hypothetical protein J1605_001758 [Eschrichtius robustus]|uniref:Brain mitochondrial carrier protein 1 n=1 Tax=Eschrichtius robustus TaxID=9764 RepID=A0AB34I2Z1_ESCRO|nr:hypothetical protein J1605_001758 [Eschrichtius robustus]